MENIIWSAAIALGGLGPIVGAFIAFVALKYRGVDEGGGKAVLIEVLAS